MKYDLDNLYNDLLKKKNEDVSKSYTSLLLSNKKLLAKKIGEETTEVIIEFLCNNKKQLVNESADLLYHLCAMWLSLNISPEEIWIEFNKRKNMSGLTEKKNRKFK